MQCFQPGISIEDDVALIVRYNSGATMSYHLVSFELKIVLTIC